MRALAISLVLFLFGGSWPAGAGTDPTVGETVAASGGTGNADIYSGGDPRARRLELARARLSDALDVAASRGDVCSAARCDAKRSPSLCAVLESLTPAQKAGCDGFVRSTAALMRREAEPKRSPIALSAQPLTVSGRAGQPPRRVPGMTAPSGRILFHAGSIDGMGEDEILALFAHELGHRISAPGLGRVLDDSAAGSFPRGALLLDAAGTALALLAIRVAPPAQEPRAVPAERLAGFCRAPDPVVAGWLVDTGVPDGAPAASADTVLRSGAARREWLRAAFQSVLRRDILDDEEAFFLARFAEGERADSILASLFSTPEYAGTGHAPFVTSFFRDMAGRAPTAAELEEARASLARFDRASWALARFRHSEDVQASVVRAWYQRFLNRGPSPAELAVELKRLAAGAGWEEAQSEILGGDEYAALQRKRATRCPAAKERLRAQAR